MLKNILVNTKTYAWLFISSLFLMPFLYSTDWAQYYIYPKTIFLDVLISIAAFGLLFFKEWSLPKNVFFYGGLTLLAVTKLASTVMNWSFVTVNSLLNAFSFILLILFISQIWKKFKFSLENFWWPLFLSTLGLFVFVAIQFYQSRYLNKNPEPLFFSATFGNINMLCEYLVFLLPLNMFFLKTQKGKYQLASALMTFCTLTILLVGQSRSVFLGILICFVYEVWKGLTKLQWLVYVLASLTYFGSQSLPTVNMDYDAVKKGSLMKRETLYWGASKMLLDHPLGIGGAQFEYSYIPYQLTTEEAPVEREKFNTPHNELLKWGIENGWLYLAAAVFVIGLLLKEIWQIKNQGKEDSEAPTFYRTSFLVMAPQVFFQFPFENPTSFLLMSILFSWFILNFEQIKFYSPKKAKLGLLLIALIFSCKAVIQTWSKWAESTASKDREAMELACPLDRSNWRLCFFYSLVLIEKAPIEGLKNTQAQLKERPFDFHALRALAFYFISQNDRTNSCEVTQVYNTFFKGTSYFSQFIRDNCQGLQNPVPFESAENFYASYRTWIKKHQN